MNETNFLWVEKYRPHKIEDVVLPSDLKDVFRNFVKDSFVPHLILSGPPGTGKTTVARAMLDEMGADYLFRNASLEAKNIDALRVDIMGFAQTVSLSGGRKYVILDEADFLNPQSTQPALRGFMEKYADNCGFILTCNFSNKIIEPLRSRCSEIVFKVPREDKPHLAGEFFARAVEILQKEGVPFDKKVVIEIITKSFPDFRRAIGEMQLYAAREGGLDSGALANRGGDYDEVIKYMKAKNYTEVRKWVGENSDIDHASVYKSFYDSASKFIEASSIPLLVIHLAKYQYQGAFSVDPQINLSACFAEIMVDCDFRDDV